MIAPTAGVIRVTAPVTGRVEALGVHEGETVAKGRLLYRLALDSVTGAGATQAQVKRLMAAQRSELEDEIARQRHIAGKHKAELITRLADLGREVEQIDRQIEQTDAEVARLEGSVRLYRGLNDRRLVANRDLLERQQMLATQRQAKESSSATASRARAQSTAPRPSWTARTRSGPPSWPNCAGRSTRSTAPWRRPRRAASRMWWPAAPAR